MRSILFACVAVLATGASSPLPKAEQSGAKVEFSLWAWDADPARRKEHIRLEPGARLEARTLPKAIMFRFRVPVAHDAVRCACRSTDAFDRVGWGPETVARDGSAAWLYRAFAEFLSYPPQVGAYSIEVEATDRGKPVARAVLRFDIVDTRPTVRDGAYLEGKKDCQGHPVTTSRPVELGGLNETPALRDNDYSFEPQHAANVIHFGRFPSFRLPPRFLAVYNSRRFTDEDRLGNPLDRGFTHQATVHMAQDNLPVAQRRSTPPICRCISSTSG
ncbi:MAG: hypothetical protein U0736_22055 [Gemmataceae bacterium]